MDIYLILYVSGLVIITVSAISLSWFVNKRGLSVVTVLFILLVILWYLDSPWRWVWLDYPSWFDQYMTNSTTWYPLYVALSVAALLWGKRRKASKGFMWTVTLLPLLSWLPWGFVLVSYGLIFWT